MAQIYKGGKTWSYLASYVDIQGKQRQPSNGGFGSQALAKADVLALSEL
ncbi:Arm DNA-binding domain-containing protein [Lacticaseibacillus hulanensis]|nr:hypothetical protein [Lacticaseibacillus hulanensis]